MSFNDHFSTLADNYARYRPHYPDALYQYLATLTPTHQLAWDCATGSGQAARGLARHYHDIIATDASLRQLARATPQRGIHYSVAAAEAAPLADASVDLICVAQALHWFDLERFTQQIRRVLKPTGVLALWSYGLARIDAPTDAVIEHLYSDILGPWWPPERALVERGYHDIELPFSELAGPEFVMQADWRLDQLCGYLSSWSAVKKYRDAHASDPLDRINEQLGRAWGAADRSHTVTWPLTLRCFRHHDG